MPVPVDAAKNRRLKDVRSVVEQQLLDHGTFNLQSDGAARKIARLATWLARADNGYLWLVNDHGDEMRLAGSYGAAECVTPELSRPGYSVQSFVWQSGKDISVEDVLTDGRINDTELSQCGIRSLMAVPVIGGGTVRGVLGVGRQRVQRFIPNEAHSLSTLAALVSELQWQGEVVENANETAVSAGSRTALPAYPESVRPQLAATPRSAQLALDQAAASAAIVWAATPYVKSTVSVTNAGISDLSSDVLSDWVHHTLATLTGVAGATIVREGPELLENDERCGSTALVMRLRQGEKTVGLAALLFRDSAGKSIKKHTLLLKMLAEVALAEIAGCESAYRAEDTGRRMHQIQAHKEVFVSAAGHYLRTPLTSIKGFAQLLARSGCTYSAEADQPGTIIAESDRLAQVIDDVINMERMEARIVGLKPTGTDLVPLLSSVKQGIDRTSGGGRLFISLPVTGLDVWVDRRETSAALSSIILSMAAVSGDGWPLQLSARSDGDYVQIIIKATVNKRFRDTWERMLSKPFSMDGDQNRARHAVARDLYIARNIIEAEGGLIISHWKRSGGLHLIIYLPASTHPRGKR